MKIEINLVVLPVLLILFTLISVNLSSFNSVFAQGNSLGQHGEGNEASQSDVSSQASNQNSMCISGESTSLSCNNLSSKSVRTTGPDEQEPSGPQSIDGKVYEVVGDEVEGDNAIITSTANCNEGDTVMGGGFKISPLLAGSSNIESIQSNPTSGLNGWEVTIEPNYTVTIQATAVCFDNT